MVCGLFLLKLDVVLNRNKDKRNKELPNHGTRSLTSDLNKLRK